MDLDAVDALFQADHDPAEARVVCDVDFQDKIREAARDPDSKVAEEVLETVLPVLAFGGRNTIAGALGDSTSLTRAMAMANRYGPPFCLLTLTPDDINNPTSFRLACTHPKGRTGAAQGLCLKRCAQDLLGAGCW